MRPPRRGVPHSTFANFSPGASGSLIDRVANTIFWRNFSVDDVIALSRGEGLSPSFFGTLLHETTHFACFNSPVMDALALWQMQYTHRLMDVVVTARDETACDRNRSFAVSGWLMTSALHNLLAVLHEGCATAIEFAEPQATPALFSALNIADAIDRSWSGPQYTSGRFHDVHTRYLASDQTQARKSVILGANANGYVRGVPYLLGYVIVRAAHTYWRKSNPTLSTHESVAFIRERIFHDAQLVQIMLNPVQTDVAVEKAQARVFALLKELFTPATAASLNRLRGASAPPPNHYPSLAVFDERVRKFSGSMIGADLTKESPLVAGALQREEYFAQIIVARRFLQLWECYGKVTYNSDQVSVSFSDAFTIGPRLYDGMGREVVMKPGVRYKIEPSEGRTITLPVEGTVIRSVAQKKAGMTAVTLGVMYDLATPSLPRVTYLTTPDDFLMAWSPDVISPERWATIADYLTLKNRTDYWRTTASPSLFELLKEMFVQPEADALNQQWDAALRERYAKLFAELATVVPIFGVLARDRQSVRYDGLRSCFESADEFEDFVATSLDAAVGRAGSGSQYWRAEKPELFFGDKTNEWLL